MTDKPIKVKSHAERLASFLEQMEQMFPNPQAAAELRRLTEVNQALVEALEKMTYAFLDTEGSHGQLETDAINKAEAALAKAKEST